MKTKSKSKLPASISVFDLAGMAEISERRIRQLIVEGRLPSAKNGVLPFAAVKSLLAYYQRDTEEISRERLLKMTAERRLRERELARADGEIVSLPEVFRVAAGFAAELHQVWKHRSEVASVENAESKMKSLGIEPGKIAAMRDFWTRERQKITDLIETDAEKFADDFSNKLTDTQQSES